MKRLLLGIMFLGILVSPLKADASSPNFAFHIGGEEWVHESVAPMELMEDTVEVTNETESPLQFRLVDTENLNGSSLYDVMMYSYNNSDFVKLNELSSEWVQVESGETVDSNDIKKHKKDILRIVTELMLENTANLPATVKSEIDTFIKLLEQEPFDENSLKNYGIENQEVVAVLRRVFE